MNNWEKMVGSWLLSGPLFLCDATNWRPGAWRTTYANHVNYHYVTSSWFIPNLILIFLPYAFYLCVFFVDENSKTQFREVLLHGYK